MHCAAELVENNAIFNKKVNLSNYCSTWYTKKTERIVNITTEQNKREKCVIGC
jgi:hypothetical protein